MDEQKPDLRREAALAGRVHALMMITLAMAETHPNRASLKENLEGIYQTGLANMEGTLIADATIESYQLVFDTILSHLNTT